MRKKGFGWYNLPEEVRNKLKAIGRKDETYDELLRRLTEKCK